MSVCLLIFSLGASGFTQLNREDIVSVYGESDDSWSTIETKGIIWNSRVEVKESVSSVRARIQSGKCDGANHE